MRKRRRKRRRRVAGYYAAWAAICIAEALLSAAPTALGAAVFIPMANSCREQPGFGSEYLLLAIIFIAAFTAIHNWTCDRIFGREGRNEIKGIGRKISWRRHPFKRMG